MKKSEHIATLQSSLDLASQFFVTLFKKPEPYEKQNERQRRCKAMPHAPHSASKAAKCFQQVKLCGHNRLNHQVTPDTSKPTALT